ncbi:hypothetical protein BJF79_05720 [Actinomadura sp. CNU-125]|nr:hypothetical protein BJF79_05720 [Actinomadura sp. CNU-125]
MLDRVAEIAGRLGCGGAVALGAPPVSFRGDDVVRLRRDLHEVIAFMDAARRTGWVLGDVAVAPGELPVPVRETPEGRLWACSVRGFEVRGTSGVRRVAGARRVPLAGLVAPQADAAALGAGDGVAGGVSRPGPERGPVRGVRDASAAARVPVSAATSPPRGRPTARRP